MTRIVEPRAVIRYRQFLDTFYSACILDSDGRVVRQCLERKHLVLPKVLHVDVDELDDAENSLLRLKRKTDDGMRLLVRHLIDALGESRIGVNVGNKLWFAASCYPSRDAL